MSGFASDLAKKSGGLRTISAWTTLMVHTVGNIFLIICIYILTTSIFHELLSYSGMSLASGNFLPTSRTCGHRLSYAVGAPRSEDVGAVFFFFKCKYQRMRVDQSLRGEKFASR